MAKPVTNLLWKKENSKVILIELSKGVELKEHKIPSANDSAILRVLKGKVEYKTSHKDITLNSLEKVDIPKEELHSVVGIDDSICLLILD
mgnify:CR=1 FL=1|jgi:quercetin dioxygenase-like cupin family protein